MGTRILSVEDDERIRTAVKLALEDEGWAVEEADTGEEALNAFQREADLSPNDARWLWFASFIALFMWDDHAWTALFTRHLELARQMGALSTLGFALGSGIAVYAFLGEMRTAGVLEVELSAATAATGIPADPSAALSLAAVRGREAEFSELIRTRIGDAAANTILRDNVIYAFRKGSRVP